MEKIGIKEVLGKKMYYKVTNEDVAEISSWLKKNYMLYSLVRHPMFETAFNNMINELGTNLRELEEVDYDFDSVSFFTSYFPRRIKETGIPDETSFCLEKYNFSLEKVSGNEYLCVRKTIDGFRDTASSMVVYTPNELIARAYAESNLEAVDLSLKLSSCLKGDASSATGLDEDSLYSNDRFLISCISKIGQKDEKNLVRASKLDMYSIFGDVGRDEKIYYALVEGELPRNVASASSSYIARYNRSSGSYVDPNGEVVDLNAILDSYHADLTIGSSSDHK